MALGLARRRRPGPRPASLSGAALPVADQPVDAVRRDDLERVGARRGLGDSSCRHDQPEVGHPVWTARQHGLPDRARPVALTREREPWPSAALRAASMRRARSARRARGGCGARRCSAQERRAADCQRAPHGTPAHGRPPLARGGGLAMSCASGTRGEANASPVSSSNPSSATATLRRARLMFLIAAFASFLFSVSLWFAGHRDEGLFVGMWVPSILALGCLILSTGRAGS